MGSTPYRVGLTADCAAPDGSTIFGDVGLHRLVEAGLSWEVMPEAETNRATGEHLAPYDAVLSFGHLHVGREAVRAAPRLRHVARFGAGYDGIDVPGLAAEGVVVTTTPHAVRRPLALAAMTLLLAMSHRLMDNHRAASSGRWTDRGSHRGLGLMGRTVGIVGLGGVGADLATLVRPLGVSVVASHHVSATERAADLGVPLLPLEQLAAESDYVILTAALTESSYRMVDRAFLSTMRPTAYLINVARGGLVDQMALVEALEKGWIAGAGLDVLDPEPPAPADPVLSLPNVIVTPHALCWTADFTREVSASVIDAIIDVARGRRPAHPLDPRALEVRRGS